jgi:hypothetical protein
MWGRNPCGLARQVLVDFSEKSMQCPLCGVREDKGRGRGGILMINPGALELGLWTNLFKVQLDCSIKKKVR